MDLRQRLIDWDFRAFESLNQPELGEAFVRFCAVATWLGTLYVWVPILLLLAATRLRARWRPFLATLAAGLLVGGLINAAIKRLVDRPRPAYYSEEKVRLHPERGRPHRVTLRGATERKHSFPSGHSQTAFGCALGLSLFVRRRFAAPLLLLAAFVGFTRIHLGVHYPLDVLGGAAVGCFGVALAWRVASRTRAPPARAASAGA